MKVQCFKCNFIGHESQFESHKNVDEDGIKCIDVYCPKCGELTIIEHIDVKSLCIEAKELIIKKLPPIDFGEDKEVERLYEILETIENSYDGKD